MSEADRFCIEWLRDYQTSIGDADPTSKEHSLNQGTIQNQYQNFYVPEAMQQLTDMHCGMANRHDGDRRDDCTIESDSEEGYIDEMETGDFVALNTGPVSYKRFCELWRVVFPDLVNRPYRSIMGKCKWCGLIDIGRNQATDAVS